MKKRRAKLGHSKAALLFSAALTVVSLGVNGTLALLLFYNTSSMQNGTIGPDWMRPAISKPLAVVQSPVTVAPRKSQLPIAESYAWRDEPEDVAKGDLQLTVINKTEEQNPAESAEASSISDSQVASNEAVLADSSNGGLPEGLTPMLRSNSKGIAEISNFSAVAMAGGADECLALGQSMVEAARMSDSLLNVLVSSPEITVAKICASNGSVVLTCRGGRITVSPRQVRPDDRCQRA